MSAVKRGLTVALAAVVEQDPGAGNLRAGEE